jgi:hypothetical protein
MFGWVRRGGRRGRGGGEFCTFLFVSSSFLVCRWVVVVVVVEDAW